MLMPMSEPTPCTAVVIRNSAGWVLMFRRRSGRFAGLWHLPGGRNLPGESSVSCAGRELFEESGLRADPADLVYLGTTHQDELAGVVFEAHRVEGDAHNAEPEWHDAWGWFDPRRPPEPLMTGAADVLGWLLEGKAR